jgi:co-chaperonin GroES (HSP10)
MKVMKIKAIKPLFNSIITTAEKYEEDATKNGIIDASRQQGTLKEVQMVIAVGSAVRDINVGDIVSINPIRYAVKKYDKDSIRQDVAGGNPIVGYQFDFVEINGEDYLHLQDRDINYVITAFKEEEVDLPKASTTIIMPPTDIIV